jgi:hypothetical protein
MGVGSSAMGKKFGAGSWRVTIGALALAAGLVGAARDAWAGPLDRGVVDKDATWLFHLDAEAGLASTCGRMMLDQVKEEKENHGEEMVCRFGVDPTKDIKSLTVYGFKAGEDDGVAVVVTSAAVDGLGAKLEAAKLEDFDSRVRDGVARYSWKGGGQSWYVEVRSGPTPERRLVLVAPSRAALECGLAVVAGSRPSIRALDSSQSGGAMVATPSEGSILFAAADRLGECPKFKASTIREARSLVVDVGERAGESGTREVFAKATVSATDVQVATNLQQMIQGMIGFASMMARNNQAQGLADSLMGVKVTTEGATIVVSAHEDAEKLMKKLTDFETSVKSNGKGLSVSVETSNEEGEKASEKKEK